MAIKTETLPPRPSTYPLYFVGSVFLVAFLFVASVASGSVSIPWQEVVRVLTFREALDPGNGQILVDFRLPRALTASLAGAALALAGLQMQTIFRNPLADPFVLGVSAGASLGVAVLILAVVPLGAGLISGLAPGNAFRLVVAASIGSGLVLALILWLSNRVEVMTLLIIGLMVAYLVNALVSILIFFAMPDRLQAFLAWTFGHFGGVTWKHFEIFGPTLAIALLLGSLRARSLDAFLIGEEQARAIGENVALAKWWILASGAVLAGTVTAFCGPIGFLGVAVPHLARGILKTNSHRQLIPVVLLLGAALALAADLIARLPGSAATLPVNAVTALIGAPVIVWVLLRGRHLTQAR